MKNIFILLFLLLLLSQCQSKSDQQNEEAAQNEQVLVIISTIQEKIYDRPSVKGLGIALVQPQETLQILDTTDYFFYKVKLQRATEAKEGFILKAAFTDKPHLMAAESLQEK